MMKVKFHIKYFHSKLRPIILFLLDIVFPVFVFILDIFCPILLDIVFSFSFIYCSLYHFASYFSFDISLQTCPVHPWTWRWRRWRRRAACWAGIPPRVTVAPPSWATSWRSCPATAASGRPSPRTCCQAPPSRSATSPRATRWSSVFLLPTRQEPAPPPNPAASSSRIHSVSYLCFIKPIYAQNAPEIIWMTNVQQDQTQHYLSNILWIYD